MDAMYQSLVRLLGERSVIWAEAVEDHSPVRHSGDFHGSLEGSILVRPSSTAEVAEVVRLAGEHGCPIVAVGGRTGTVGGVEVLGPSLLLSMERLNRIEEIDPVNMTVTAGAGVILQTLQEAVEAQGFVLPVDIGARGSATVGGIVSTNAGGLRAIKWGVTRDAVLGVEAVLANGAVVDGLRKLLKDNAGYDWKHLLIGSEGTLGLVTRAVLRLRPRPGRPVTALLACADVASALTVLRRLGVATGDAITSFELMWGDVYDFITTSSRWGHSAPLPPGYPFYAIVELEGSEPITGQFEPVIEQLSGEGLLLDGVVASSEKQRQGIWATRDDMSPLATVGPIFPYDVSVPLDAMDRLARAVADRMATRLPQARLFTFGHAGDGNLHFVVAPGPGREQDGAVADTIIFEEVSALRGSISAEHGVGLYRREALGYCRSPEEIELMRCLKRALDPAGLLNPGKVLAMGGS